MWSRYCTHRYRIWWCHAVVLRTPVQVVREERSPALSSGHYEALTGPVDYHPRGNGYNTFFFRSTAIAHGFQAKPVSNSPLLLWASSPSPSRTHIPKNFLAFDQHVGHEAAREPGEPRVKLCALASGNALVIIIRRWTSCHETFWGRMLVSVISQATSSLEITISRNARPLLTKTERAASANIWHGLEVVIRTCSTGGRDCKVISSAGRTFVPWRPDCAFYDFMPSGRLKVIINFKVIKIYRAPNYGLLRERGRDISLSHFSQDILYGWRRGAADFSTTSIKVTAINFTLNKLASSGC